MNEELKEKIIYYLNWLKEKLEKEADTQKQKFDVSNVNNENELLTNIKDNIGTRLNWFQLECAISEINRIINKLQEDDIYTA